MKPTLQQSDLVGTTIAGIQIQRQLGAGANGTVYLGLHRLLGHLEAVKILPPEPPPKPALIERFYREARALAQLQHPGIVRVFDVGQHERWHYIRMQFIQGRNLEHIVASNGPAPLIQALRIARDIASAMAAAHGVGILHRDLKPANILYVESADELKLIDFGLSRIDSESAEDQLTVRGAIMGTPKYMAPEQASAQPTGPRTDIYGLGAVLYFLLSGHAPFEGKALEIVVRKRRGEEARDLGQLISGFPFSLSQFVRWLMAPDPEHRPDSMAAVRDLLDSVLKAADSQPVEGERPSAALKELAAVVDAARQQQRRGGVLPVKPDASPVIESVRLDANALAAGLGSDFESIRQVAPNFTAVELPPPDSAAEAPGEPITSWVESTIETKSPAALANEASGEVGEITIESKSPTALANEAAGGAVGEITIETKSPAVGRTADGGAPAAEATSPDKAPTATWNMSRAWSMRVLEEDFGVLVAEREPATNDAAELLVSDLSGPSSALNSGSSAASARMAVPDRLGFRALVQLEPDDVEVEDSHQRIGGYHVAAKLGEGGMGVIWEVRDPNLNRHVAMKVLRDGRAATQQQIDKFLMEAQITGQLEHPNIVPVHELGIGQGGRVFFTMKFVRGHSLNSILKELKHREQTGKIANDTIKSFTLRQLLDIFLKVCDALAFAHARGVVHRDLKPDNVMVGEFGEVQLMDWGLAKVLKGAAEPAGVSGRLPRISLEAVGAAESAASRDSARNSNVDVNLAQGVGKRVRGDTTRAALATLDGTVVGTPAFMPPEQAKGDIDQIDQRSDIYSLGAILYQLLTLELPISTEGGLIAMLINVTAGHITPPTQRAPHRRISSELEAVVMKAMALKQANRYASVTQLQADIRAWLDGHTLSAVNYSATRRIAKWVGRNRLLTVASLVVLTVGIGVFVSVREWQAAERNEQIARYLSAAQTAMKQSAADRAAIGGDTAPELRHLQSAATAFDRVLALDSDHEAARKGRLDVASRQAAIQALAEQAAREREQKASETARLEQQQRDAQDRLARAGTLLAKARDQLARTTERLNQDLAQLAATSDGDRVSKRQALAGGYEEAVQAVLAAAELQPEDRAIREFSLKAVQERDAGLQRWDRDLEALLQLKDAQNSAALGVTALANGKRNLALARTLQAQTAEQVPGNQAALEAQQRQIQQARNQAFADLLAAITAAKRAVVQFAPLAAAAKDRAQAGETIRDAQLELTVHALETGQYELAEIWLKDAERDAEGGEIPAAIKAMRARLDQERSLAEGYATALKAGDREMEAGNYDTAIANFERAKSKLDTAAVNERIAQTQYAQALALARKARADQRWTAARDHYAAAKKYASDAGRRDQIQSLMAELASEAAADLLAKARQEISTGKPERLAAATDLLSQCLEFSPNFAAARQLRTQLKAINDTPAGFVFFPGGRVALGSSRTRDRNPARVADVRPFYVAQRELTVGEFRKFIAAAGYTTEKYWSEAGWKWLNALPEAERTPAGIMTADSGLPVTGVCALEAEAYCRWLSESTGAPTRLPTDDEWETVARHAPAELEGTGRLYPWGNEWETGRLAAANDVLSTGQNPADCSGFGCLDLGGNAAEWVTVDATDAANAERPRPGFGLRGASNRMRVNLREWFASTTKRGFSDPTARSAENGFRIVRSVPNQ